MDFVGEKWKPRQVIVCLLLFIVVATQFAELAAANFLHLIHPAKDNAANSANAVLAGQICPTKTTNSRTRLTIIYSKLAAAKFLHSIHTVKVVAAYSAN